jgi:hypothetical protein
LKALDRATAMALHKKQEAFYLGNRSSLACCWNWAHGGIVQVEMAPNQIRRCDHQ